MNGLKNETHKNMGFIDLEISERELPSLISNSSNSSSSSKRSTLASSLATFDSVAITTAEEESIDWTTAETISRIECRNLWRLSHKKSSNPMETKRMVLSFPVLNRCKFGPGLGPAQHVDCVDQAGSAKFNPKDGPWHSMARPRTWCAVLGRVPRPTHGPT